MNGLRFLGRLCLWTGITILLVMAAILRGAIRAGQAL